MKTFAALCCTFGLAVSISLAAAEPTPIRLWSGRAPDETKTLPPEADQTTAKDNLIAGRRLIRLGNVSDPTMTIYSPTADKNTGAAVLVFPGGGYNILAYDLEGTEVCEWFNSIGVTAILVKYRVPVRSKVIYAAPLQDAQRALGLVRSQADKLGIDPHRIGILGFSAGGNLAVMLSTSGDTRTYPAVDKADQVSCVPDFTLLIYPGHLSDKEHEGNLYPEIHVTGTTPPTFLVMAEDDPVGVENVTRYYSALKNAKVPAEMHVYAEGGHGYGLRRTAQTVTSWPDRAADWMKAHGWLAAAK